MGVKIIQACFCDEWQLFFWLKTRRALSRPKAVWSGVKHKNIYYIYSEYSDRQDWAKQCRRRSDAAEYGIWSGFVLSATHSRPRWLSWMRHPTGDQEVAGSTPAEVGNILSWRLIMKYFLRSFSPFRWFKKGSCQFLEKECAQYWLTA